MINEDIKNTFIRNKLEYLLIGENNKISKLSFEALCNLEISHQECKQLDNDFDIKNFIVFDRDPYENWPDCSIIGDELYRDGKKIEAYKMFDKINTIEIDALSIPSWSQGIYGMKIDEIKKIPINIEKHYERKINFCNKFEFCVGFDDKYFPYLKILSNSLIEYNVTINAIYCYDKIPNKNLIDDVKKIENVNLYVIETPDVFSFKNRKGFYTLVRYLLANIRINETDLDQVVIDIDSRVNDIEPLENCQNHDVCILELHKPRRPWLKHTAPFLYISNNSNGKKFLKTLASKCSYHIDKCERGDNISLWGIDQASITSTIDYHNYKKDDITYFNFIPLINRFLLQAQQLSMDKSIFINKYIRQ